MIDKFLIRIDFSNQFTKSKKCHLRHVPEFLLIELMNCRNSFSLGSWNLSYILPCKYCRFVEQSVRTVKLALNGWKQVNTHIPLSQVLKKLLFHRKVSTLSCGNSLAEIILGRQTRCPICARRFNQGESQFFRPNEKHPITTAECAMAKGENTSLIL